METVVLDLVIEDGGLIIEDLEERSQLDTHGACACTCSCGCTSCSCVAWAS